MMLRSVLLSLTLALLAPGTTAQASDLEREKRLSNQIVDAIFDGEPFFLTADDHEFLAIHMRADADPARGAAIILHGRGYHPNWEDVAYPLRTGLPAQGWDTLSLQMPVLEKSAKYYDYVPIFAEAHPRIEAGIAYLREQGHDNIVLIAHSCGAHMAMDWIGSAGDEAINAYVGIGMGATDYQQPMLEPFPLNEMQVPVLDIYGGEEYPAVKKMAPERLAAMRAAGNAHSEQVVVEGADHYFKGKGQALTDRVGEWLNGLPLE